jgi:hypothetical protein
MSMPTLARLIEDMGPGIARIDLVERDVGADEFFSRLL